MKRPLTLSKADRARGISLTNSVVYPYACDGACFTGLAQARERAKLVDARGERIERANAAFCAIYGGSF